jgi:ElaB/YqjD/DUF883 family membrane-anchored ribosome-binding protein
MDRTRENSGDAPAEPSGRSIGETAASMTERVGDSLEHSRAALTDMQEMLTERTRECMHATDVYVRDNPWQAVGIAAGLGLVLGLLLGRR